ncbi:relaxin-3-like [Varanus komodoensis]|uniref:relaxin-3-like n=1 Tax=Varanus komodoensis TaxID=61221 RepID=UPI001CF7D6C5|nr:relaxin-3-like [Varanus komodoensis]
MGAKKLLPLLLLAPLLLLHCASAQEEEAVKLCGRDLVRAVIFTCGGSRWKRLSLQQQQPLPLGNFVQSSSDKGPENIKLQPGMDPKLEQLQSDSQPAGQQSLKDLFNLYDSYNEYVPTLGNFNEYIHQLGDASRKSRDGTGQAMDSVHFPWIKYPQRKRDISGGIAEVCCKWGCTRKEIGALC